MHDNKKSYVYDSYKSDCLSKKLFKISKIEELFFTCNFY